MKFKLSKGFFVGVIVVLLSLYILYNLSEDKMYALIETSKGNIKVELFPDKAPVSVENFKNYATSGFYEGLVFHRVIRDFMVQGGGFTSDGAQKQTSSPIKNEANNGLLNKRGSIAMARTNEVDSATSQFFINLVDNDFLNYQDDNNYGYAVFGEVVEGMEVVELIGNASTTTKGAYENWPIEDIIITKVTIIE